MSLSEPIVVEGFNLLKVKYSRESSVIRHLFIKEHKVRETNDLKPIGKTLFVINIPPFVDEHCFQHLFSDCGKIVNIFFHSKPTSCAPIVNKSKYFDKSTDNEINGYKVAYIVFSSHSSLQKAFKLSTSSHVLTLKPNSEQHLIGLKAMKHKYNEQIVDINDMQNEINHFITQYDMSVEKEKLMAKETDGMPDSEGWIKVNRHSKRKHLPNNQLNDQKIVDKHNKRRKKSSNDLQNFYSFQVKESKIEYLLQLRNKFEDDKKRIALMKAHRKFKPF
jgi:ribosomal RNA-processing protein 7